MVTVTARLRRLKEWIFETRFYVPTLWVLSA